MLFFFFFNDTATTEIYTLSLHDALPISSSVRVGRWVLRSSSQACSRSAILRCRSRSRSRSSAARSKSRSEEHTSELQSRQYLVCRLLLEKKKKKYKISMYHTVYKTKLAD